MIHHIVFHDDIDGIIAASIYLHDHVVIHKYRLYPISTFIKDDRFKDIVRGMNLNDNDFLVVLDYLYHERANLWVNHRGIPSMGDQEVTNSKLIYNPKASSTTSLMLNVPNARMEVKYDKSFLKSFLDVIDTIVHVKYKSVDQVFSDTSPLMVLRAFVERTFPSEMTISRIVEMIARENFDFEKVMYQLKIDSSLLEEVKKEAKSAKSAMITYDTFSVINQRRPNQYPKYSEFFVRPETKYSVRFSNTGNNRLYLHVGYNKWHKDPNEVNIGLMLSNFKYLISGGGQFNSGGGILNATDSERLLDDLSIHLNKEEPMDEMEKVGVDKEADPIESKAELMVKTGEAVNLNDAREKASLKKEEKTAQEGSDAGDKSQ